MPVYLLHGFRWPRPLVRIHIILQNLDDAAAEWLVAPGTSKALRENFEQLYPECMEHLQSLRFVEQYDPADESSEGASQPFAYVADVVETVRLGIDVDEVRQRGVSSDQWAAMMELRDRLAPEEHVGWYVVFCGDEERPAPATLSDGTKSTGLAETPLAGSESNSLNAITVERQPTQHQQIMQQPRKPERLQKDPPASTNGNGPSSSSPNAFKKLFGAARMGRRKKSRADLRGSSTPSDSSQSPHRAPASTAASPIPTQLQKSPATVVDKPSSHTGDVDSPVGHPSIAEVPDTSAEAIARMTAQPRGPSLDKAYVAEPKRSKNSTAKRASQSSFSAVNYSAIYDQSKNRMSLPNLVTAPGPDNADPRRLTLDTVSLDASNTHDPKVVGGAVVTESPIAADGKTIANGSVREVVSPLTTFDQRGLAHLKNARINGSTSPVSAISSTTGGRRSRRGTALSTISDQTINPNDLLAKNLDWTASRLGT